MPDLPISPGVRELVAELNGQGFVTTDSGDGSNYVEGMECALPFRHVFGFVPDNATLEECAERLQELYPDARVEVSYSPGEPGLFMIYPDGSPEARKPER